MNGTATWLYVHYAPLTSGKKVVSRGDLGLFMFSGAKL